MSKELTKAAIENLAKEIRQYLLDRDMWIDTRIYFGGVAYDSDTPDTLPNMNPHDYTEYAGDILTMTFEGPLYEALNYGGYGDNPWQVEEELTAIFCKYGLYFEMGEYWNLTAYPL